MAEQTTQRPSMLARHAWIVALPVAMLMGACGQPPDDSPQQQVSERLVGTWLREYQEGGTSVRRVLVLGPDGHFREMASITEPGASAAQYAHAGEWRFDGTNLKRRYTEISGGLPAAPTVPFATFELRFPSHNEFIGTDHVHHRQVRYRRVEDGTLP